MAHDQIFIRHPEVAALAALEGRRPDQWPFILRGSLRSHLRMTDPASLPTAHDHFKRKEN
jgi:hypothetical protein